MILFRTFVTASFHPDFCRIPAVVLPAGDAAGISYHKIRRLSINRRLFFLYSLLRELRIQYIMLINQSIPSGSVNHTGRLQLVLPLKFLHRP